MFYLFRLKNFFKLLTLIWIVNVQAAQLKIRRSHGYDKNKANKYKILVESSFNLNLRVVGLMLTINRNPRTIYIRRISNYAVKVKSKR